MKAVIVGASTGVGRALALRLALEGASLFLVARGERDLDSVISDLSVRFQGEYRKMVVDLCGTSFDPQDLLDAAVEFLAEVDSVFFPVGAVSESDVGVPDPGVVEQMMTTNAVAVLKAASCFGEYFQKRRQGRIVLFSSIAAAAPRNRNTAYSAAKAAIETFAKGLRHTLEPSGVRVHVCVLGYVDTAMTFGKRLFFPIASPVRIADDIVRDLKSPGGRKYYPRFWGPVTLILRHLPWWFYRKLSF